MEQLKTTAPLRVWIDSAKESRTLDEALQQLQQTYPGKIICVIGGHGQLSIEDHSALLHTAMKYSSKVVVTSNNPAWTKIEALFDFLKKSLGSKNQHPRPTSEHGVCENHPHSCEVFWQSDRREAIEIALQMAKAGDTVLIAGKGHETTQVIQDAIIPFDDRIVAREALQRQQGKR